MLFLWIVLYLFYPGTTNAYYWLLNISALILYVVHGQALTERSGVRERRREERAVFIMWCPAVCYTDPYSEIPACVYITTENLHVFVVCIIPFKSNLISLSVNTMLWIYVLSRATSHWATSYCGLRT